MSDVYTPTGSAWSASVTVPEDGDWVTAATWSTPFSQLAEMHAWTRAKVLSGGVRAIRLVSDVPALAALTGMTTGQVAIVPQVGLYRYDGASWLAQGLYGVATTDTWGKVPLALLAYQRASETWVPDVQNPTTVLSTASAPVALSGSSTTLSVQAGDIVVADATIYVLPSSVPAIASASVRIGQSGAYLYSPVETTTFSSEVASLGLTMRCSGRWIWPSLDEALEVAVCVQTTTNTVAATLIALRARVERP